MIEVSVNEILSFNVVLLLNLNCLVNKVNYIWDFCIKNQLVLWV